MHLGYVAVLRYLINHRYVSPHMIDYQGRTLPFLAIMYNKPLVLKFLLTVRLDSTRPYVSKKIDFSFPSPTALPEAKD